MLDEDVRLILRERRWLFRGTNDQLFKPRNGIYVGAYNRNGVVTSTSLSVLYAMIYATNYSLVRYHGAHPLLLAIDARPYINHIEKGLEWKPFLIDEDIVTKDEYEIRTPIRTRHVHRIETAGELRVYTGDIPEKAFKKLMRKFDELTSSQQDRSAG